MDILRPIGFRKGLELQIPSTPSLRKRSYGRVGMTNPMKLLLAAEVLVGFVDPVFARRIEDVEIDRVHQRFGFMRHVGRNGQDFARTHDDFFSVDPELERAIKNVGDLLVVMAVLGNDASFFQQNASQHDVLADDEMAPQKRIEVFDFDRAPRDVLEPRFLRISSTRFLFWRLAPGSG